MEALREGISFVTNGLMRDFPVGGQHVGDTLRLGASLDLTVTGLAEIQMLVANDELIDKVSVVQDVPPSNDNRVAKPEGLLQFEQSGWWMPHAATFWRCVPRPSHLRSLMFWPERIASRETLHEARAGMFSEGGSVLDRLTNPHRTGNGVDRRTALKIGALGVGGLTMADYFRLQAHAATAGEYRTSPSKKSVILLWQNGGPSHLETYDLKPEAVREIRGPFSPIKTNVPGIEVCELLPLHARIADKFTLIRSCSHNFAGHNDGIPVMMSGFPDWSESKNESVYPELGAVVNRVFGQCSNGMPVACGMGATHYSYVPTTATGYWGNMYRPPTVSERGLPNATATVDSRRLDDRRTLLGQIDRLRTDLDSGALDSLDAFHRQAFEIIGGDRARTAFDLTREDPRLRARYGEGWGQQALLARRLVEAGVNFVTVGVPGGKEIYNWDDHAVNGDLPTAMRERLPGLDQGVSALIEDIYQRGLDQDVLVIVTGEFGRTPRGNEQKGNSNGKLNWGRDHWPHAMSILVSGGGKPMGQVIGATNSKGEHPVQRELTPQNFRSMIFHHLGIDYHQSFLDPAGRPIHISYGEHIPELA